MHSFMAYILHIDTSAETGNVALAKDGRLLAVKVQTNARNHAATINTDIEQLMTDNNISLDDISAFCVNGGPGSYTGLRIGLATAKGFCYAMNKPLMIHNRLLIMSLAGIMDPGNNADIYMSVLLAREGEYFIATYDKDTNAIIEPVHIVASNLGQLVADIQGRIFVTGHIDDAISGILQGNDVVFNPAIQHDYSIWAVYTHAEFNCNRIVSLAHAEPFYLKQVYTHKPKIVS